MWHWKQSNFHLLNTRKFAIHHCYKTTFQVSGFGFQAVLAQNIDVGETAENSKKSNNHRAYD